MSWLSLLSAVLKLGGLIASIVREKQLMDAGAEREVARQLRAIATSAGVARAIEAETNAMTPEEIARDLEGHGELRD